MQRSRQIATALSLPLACLSTLCSSQQLRTPETSRHFTKWMDPGSGVVSYVLTTRVAAQQQSFYFVNRSMTADGRFLWFYCMNPPSGARTMGVVDFQADEVHHFPEIRFQPASPFVDLETGDLYWTNREGVFRHSPTADGETQKVSGVPECFPKPEHAVCQLACHLTRNHSGTRFFLDARVDNQCVCGDLNIATGAFTEWGRSAPMLNHAQFCPTDDNLVLICKEFWNDLVTKERHRIPTNSDGVYERLWLWRKGEARKLVPPIDGGGATHEWWGADGKCFYYCAYPKSGNPGIACYDVASGKQHMVTNEHATHAHSSLDSRYFVFDQAIGGQYRGCAWKVFFHNSENGRTVCIVTRNPEYNTPEKPSTWHPDPHPQFVAADRYVVSTLNIDKAMNVLVTPVAPLVELTK